MSDRGTWGSGWAELPQGGRSLMRTFANEFDLDPDDYIAMTRAGVEADAAGLTTIGSTRSMAAHWHLRGRQSVVMPHRYAAALMATDFAESPFPAMPWPCFEVVVPSGLLVTTTPARECQAVYLREEIVPKRRVTTRSDRLLGVDYDAPVRVISGIIMFDKTISATQMFEHEFHTQMRITEDSYAVDDRIAETDYGELGRACTLALRLAANVVLDILTTPSVVRIQVPGPRYDGSGKAVNQTTQIGKPLTLDCRREIRDYVIGARRSEPKVTTLVRGHWRHQVHGVGRLERKRIWIQPFYRGHGPMLVRPVRVGFGEAAKVDEASQASEVQP